MKHLFTLLPLTLAFAITPWTHTMSTSASGGKSQIQVLDRMVAVVNDQVILQSQLDRGVATVQQQYRQKPVQLPPLDILRRQVLERLILMQLQLQNANHQGIRVSAQEVDQALQTVARRNHMTSAQLRIAIRHTGQSYATFRHQLHDQLMVQHLKRNVVQSSVTVTDSEVDNLLGNPVHTTDEVHLAHIDINITHGATAARIRAAANKIQTVLNVIRKGMPFHAAAIHYSNATDALDGGDLGWRRPDDMPPAFARRMIDMKPGQISPPLRSPTGFHIIKLIARRHPQQIVSEFHARHILIQPNALVSMQQAQQKIQSLYNRLKKGQASFSALARQYSDDDMTASNGGDMGWFQQNTRGQVIDQQITQLKEGAISHPFQTSQGWHLLKLLGIRQKNITRQMARRQARLTIGNRKAEQFYQNYLRRLRANAYVKILVPAMTETGHP